MKISELVEEKILIVSLSGRLDAKTSDGVKDNLLARLTGPDVRLVVDFSELTYVSSAGLRVFLELARRASTTQGKFALCAMTRQVQQVFELAGLTSLLPIYATREAARTALQ
jgi:anti-sigma B factor antagonist